MVCNSACGEDERSEGNILSNQAGFSSKLAGKEPKLNGQDTAGAAGKDAKDDWSATFDVCVASALAGCVDKDSFELSASVESDPMPDLSCRLRPHLRALKAASAS